MLKVLISAYAVCPNRGSEEGMGWNWCSRIAQFCEVHVITESEFQEETERVCADARMQANGTPYSRLHFHYVPVGETDEESVRIRKMCWNQGNWAFYLKYAMWAKKALDLARTLIDEAECDGHGFDLMHQLNMVGFREPGMLYAINEERAASGKKHIPLIWGPMGGYGSIPFSFMWPGGIKFTAFYLLKNFLNELQLHFQPRVRKMLRESDYLFAATPEMKEGIGRVYGMQIKQVNETGTNISGEVLQDCGVSLHESRNREEKPTFDLLWVGRFMYTKQLPLALKTMSLLRNIPEIKLHIVGRGFDDAETHRMHALARKLGVEDLCVWHGQIPNLEVHRLMQRCDVFFFTSIFEMTSTVTLEAITNGLPIVCFDRCGFGPIVDETIGRKIACTTPNRAVKEFAEQIQYLYDHPEALERMHAGCADKSRELSWDSKMMWLRSVYESL